MFARYFLNSSLRFHYISRSLHLSRKQCEYEHPFWRTLRILREDFSRFKQQATKNDVQSHEIVGLFPRHADVLIIGGGAMGSSVAYWLKEKTSREGLHIVVIEKDTTYSKCSTVLSVGGLRQQFSLPENIQMSLYGSEFIRTIKKRFGPNADVNFTPQGYLILASDDSAQQLLDNSKLQKELGAVNVVLNKQQLKERFPWMNVDDVELGCLGLEKEGWFDPWSLLSLLRYGAMDMGVEYINAQVIDFNFKQRQDIIVQGVEFGQYESTNSAIIKMPNDEHRTIEFAYCVIAAGSDSADISKLARIGSREGILSVPLPVEKRKRYVYRFDCKGDNYPGINCPMTIDYSGAYFRRNNLCGTYLAGLSPLPSEEPNTDNLDVDYNYFDEKVWPILANRVPAFNDIKVKNAWSGYYEYNIFDENGIIGPHPYYHNLYIATGFSGHGIQQAPAVGRAVAELILDGDFKTIDLTRLGFDRFIVDKPMYEIGIY